ncbi:MAG: subclass B3 metallo-beta-lactamase, partial [Brevundimonas sp.]|nr:subclass B3 metallo-beta-lactamase [Brevundimonas sp.]
MRRFSGMATAALLVMAAGCARAEPQQDAPVAQARPDPAHDPLLQPIAPEYARQWLAVEAPTRIHGNTFFVGFGGLTVVLISTSDGLVLVDGALPQAVPALEDNVRRLGFRIEDVKYILSTEPHYDHAGGLAALARDTGATVVASPAAAAVLQRGRSGQDDPQAASLETFPPVERVRALRDGEVLRLGDVAITARATPGHTPGSMSWSWRSCEGDDCRDVVFGSSLNPVSADGYRFTNPANRALLDGFRRTFASLRAIPCDILLTAHPSQSGGDAHMARLRQGVTPNPFIDPTA